MKIPMIGREVHSNYIIPDELRFAITRKCDGTCQHCYNLSGNDIDILTTENYVRIIEEIHGLNPGMNRITLTGGEPLLEVEKLLTISRSAKSLGIKVRLVTRGWELNHELCRELKEAGITRIQIGLDSSGKFIFEDDIHVKWDTFHSWLRGDHDGFQKTTNAIKIAVSSGLDVSVRYSLCSSNLIDVVETYRLISSLGASKFKFRILFPDGRARKRLTNELISGSDMANAQYDLIIASKDSETLIEITQPCFYHLPNRASLTENKNQINAYKEKCPCGTIAAYIDSNGAVKYCLFDDSELGNVCNQSFLTIWNSKKTNDIRSHRCPLDLSGTGCSSFKLLAEDYIDYPNFIRSYKIGVKKKMKSMSFQL